MNLKRIGTLIAGLFLCAQVSAAEMVVGAGATFIAPVLYEWAESYHNEQGVKINYQSIGSGAGLKQIENKTVDFGASDKPLSEKELSEKKLFQFPAVMGAVVPVVNLKGVRSGELVLDGETLALIYSGGIKNWNDPKIKALNPNITFPTRAITVVYRSDGSGTTFNYTYYLEKVAPKIWTAGSGTAIAWPRGIQGVGGKGNEGVTSMVKRVEGAIGYVEFSYAVRNEISWTRLKNAAGQVVPVIAQADLQNEEKVSAAFAKSMQAAALTAPWKETAGMGVILANTSAKEGWPIAATTFILLPQVSAQPAKTKAALRFFDFVYKKGSKQAENLHYVSLPAPSYEYVQSQWASVLVDDQGKKLWP